MSREGKKRKVKTTAWAKNKTRLQRMTKEARIILIIAKEKRFDERRLSKKGLKDKERRDEKYQTHDEEVAREKKRTAGQDI